MQKFVVVLHEIEKQSKHSLAVQGVTSHMAIRLRCLEVEARCCHICRTQHMAWSWHSSQEALLCCMHSDWHALQSFAVSVLCVY